jgi:hypothetical protein
MQNVFDSDPPFVAGAFGNNYDASLATIKGRFWYAQVKNGSNASRISAAMHGVRISVQVDK